MEVRGWSFPEVLTYSGILTIIHSESIVREITVRCILGSRPVRCPPGTWLRVMRSRPSVRSVGEGPFPILRPPPSPFCPRFTPSGSASITGLGHDCEPGSGQSGLKPIASGPDPSKLKDVRFLLQPHGMLRIDPRIRIGHPGPAGGSQRLPIRILTVPLRTVRLPLVNRGDAANAPSPRAASSDSHAWHSPRSPLGRSLAGRHHEKACPDSTAKRT